ncbi:hypothetical protein [Hydrogenophaga sp.]|uniref:hypothetical protein n=1 Tax=Hydrogenophaga sp. TaxID=1904254 RepID=UPI0019962D96|nr:hypothetical protein [Hydrogenophaga sp.]MBD3892691.1 hypothetical protein [Hydrogenophaga sp.]
MNAAPYCEEEYTLPSVEALLAGTLALLTGYAQSAPDCANRPLLARKLVSNLYFLAAHPLLSPPMRTMLGNLRTRWQLEQEKFEPNRSQTQSACHWHEAAQRVQ